MNMPIGQFYEVSYDFAVPYNVCGGAQDNGAWCGPSRRRSGGDQQRATGSRSRGGDGFYTAQDPTDPDIVYGESQGGSASRVNLQDRRARAASASRRGTRATASGRIRSPSCAAIRSSRRRRSSRRAIAALRAQQKQDSIDLALRFNWNSPFFLSPHNPSVIYFAGNRVLKSTKRGEDFFPISPDLSKKLTGARSTRRSHAGPAASRIDATGAETYGTVVALAESYVKPGLLLAGTDDGNVWMTHNDGATWENLTGRVPGPAGRRRRTSSRIEPSHFDTLTFYVAFDNHRWNDFKPYLFVTNDGGKSFSRSSTTCRATAWRTSCT